jgi:hypothetical protein
MNKFTKKWLLIFFQPVGEDWVKNPGEGWTNGLVLVILCVHPHGGVGGKYDVYWTNRIGCDSLSYLQTGTREPRDIVTGYAGRAVGNSQA